MKSSTVQHLLLYQYRYAISYTLLIAIGAFVFLFQLGDLMPGIHADEATTSLANTSLTNIIAHPVNFPYALLQWGFIKIFGPTLFVLRLPAVFCAAAAVFLFYYLLKSWYWARVAILGSIILVTSSWLLHHARFAHPSILIVPLVIGFLLAVSLMRQTRKFRWLALAAFIGAVGLYSPYFIYFALAIVIANWRTVRMTLKQCRRWMLPVALLCWLILLLPLGYSIFRQPNLALELLGLPSVIPDLSTIFTNLIGSFGYLFWRSEINWGYHLGDLPMVDIFTAAMIALGLYHYEQHWPSLRSKALFVSIPVLIAATSLSALPVSYVILIPLFYILAANGASTLLKQWYKIFPKNPIARTVGIIPVAVLLVAVIAYHYQRYFVAWARTPEARQAFQEDYVKLRENLHENSSKIVVYGLSDEIPRYQLAAIDNPNVMVVEFKDQAALVDQHPQIYMSRSVKERLSESQTKQLSSYDSHDIIGNNQISHQPLFVKFISKSP